MAITDEQHAWIEESLSQTAPAFLMTAKRIAAYLVVLENEGVPDLIAKIAVEEWIKADAQLGLQLMIHHQARDEQRAAQDYAAAKAASGV